MDSIPRVERAQPSGQCREAFLVLACSVLPSPLPVCLGAGPQPSVSRKQISGSSDISLGDCGLL